MHTFPVPAPVVTGYPFVQFVGYILEHNLAARKFKTMLGVLRAERILKALEGENAMCSWSDEDYEAVRAIIEEEHEERALPMPVLMLTRNDADSSTEFQAPALLFAPYVRAILDATDAQKPE